MLSLSLLLACSGGGDSGTAGDSAAPLRTEPELGELRQVVPGDGLPAEVVTQDANNNLDVAWHEGRAYLAFRTAPSHFASDQTELHVVSSADQLTWTHEWSYSLGTDLREMRLLSWEGKLFLYFAVLGDDPLAFEPQGTKVVVKEGETWGEPTWWREDSFIPWRMRVMQGVPQMAGYTGGGDIYDPAEGEYPHVEVSWLKTSDGTSWQAVDPAHEVVFEGGASETDLAFADDGAIIAVLRNEAGDADGFGSLVCRGEPDALGDWRCERDCRKYDSPLVFEHGGRIWLIGRRTLNEHDGCYDLGLDDLSFQAQSLQYQAAYWGDPKRCSLWEVDPVALTVEWKLDLPSKGDTCFASVLPEDDGGYTVYNYSSDPDGPDVSWLQGQNGTTQIYAQRLWLPD